MGNPVVSTLEDVASLVTSVVALLVPLLIGVAANPCALNLDEEVRRFRYKAEAGAEFALTHSVLDAADLEAFLARVADVPIPALAGVQPLASLRHAEFLANEVPGVRVPARFVERMRGAESEGRAREEGIAIAVELVHGLRGLVQGIQVGAPEGDLGVVGAVIDAVHAAG